MADFFLDDEMSGSCRRHLREVSDGDHLVSRSEHGHLAAYGFCYLAADVGIDLIEHHQWRRILIGKSALDGQHDAADFTAGGNMAQRMKWFARIRAEEKIGGLHAVRGGILECGEGNLEGRLLEAEVFELSCNFFGKLRCGFAASAAELVGGSIELAAQLGDLRLQQIEFFAAVLDVVESIACFITGEQDVANAATVFTFERF